MKKTVVFLVMLATLPLVAQDHILIWNNGTRTHGELDTSTIENMSLRFKEDGKKKYMNGKWISPQWKFIHISEIQQVKDLNGVILFNRGCIGNTKSKIYHLPHVKHLPELSNQRTFDNVNEAINNGFKPCNACYDDRSKLAYYNLEREQAKLAILAFQNRNEILYEHESLPLVRNVLNDVLNNWPETLKGYNYRIQIYRDNNPNACAIPQGNIYVSSGLLDIAENSEELEAVIAHEVAHIERRHILQELFNTQKKQAIGALATLLAGATVAAMGGDAGDVALTMGVTSTVAQVAIEVAIKGYSRELEEQADIFAQLYYFKKNEPNTYLVNTLDMNSTGAP